MSYEHPFLFTLLSRSKRTSSVLWDSNQCWNMQWRKQHRSAGILQPTQYPLNCNTDFTKLISSTKRTGAVSCVFWECISMYTIYQIIPSAFFGIRCLNIGLFTLEHDMDWCQDSSRRSFKQAKGSPHLCAYLLAFGEFVSRDLFSRSHARKRKLENWTTSHHFEVQKLEPKRDFLLPFRSDHLEVIQYVL